MYIKALSHPVQAAYPLLIPKECKCAYSGIDPIVC
jgi:hypothetical protein